MLQRVVACGFEKLDINELKRDACLSMHVRDYENKLGYRDCVGVYIFYKLYNVFCYFYDGQQKV